MAAARIFDAGGKFPFACRNGNSLAVGLFANSERGLGLVEGGRLIAFDPLVGAERLRVYAFLVDDDLCAHPRDDRCAVVGGDRDIEHEPILERHQVALPSAPDNRVALAHQKTIAGVFQRRWIVGFRTVIQKTQDAFAAAVGRVKKNLAVTARHIERFQNAKIAGVLDSAALIALSFV